MSGVRIVKFECGCIGTEPDVNGESAIVQSCDGQSSYVGAKDRKMGDAKFEDVGDEWRMRVWEAFVKADQYEALRFILKRTIEEE